MISRSSYRCPACGEPTTEVKQTASFDACITRVRMCATCGYAHTTVEIPMNISELWREATAIIFDHAVKKARELAPKAVNI